MTGPGTTYPPAGDERSARVAAAADRLLLQVAAGLDTMSDADTVAEFLRQLAGIGAARDGHPSWCSALGLHPGSECGLHLSRAVEVPATAREFVVTDNGAAVARVDTTVSLDAAGRVAVDLVVFDPTGDDGDRWLAAALTPDEAERVAAGLVAMARLARRPVEWRADR